MSSRNLNLIKLPVDPAVLFEQITDLHNRKMARLQVAYEKCPGTEEGLILMAAIEDVGRMEIESYQAAIEQKEQTQDLSTKNSVMEKLLELAKEREIADEEKLKGYHVRVERLKESSHKRATNERNTNLYDQVNRKAPMPSRRY